MAKPMEMENNKLGSFYNLKQLSYTWADFFSFSQLTQGEQAEPIMVHVLQPLVHAQPH